MCAWRYNAAGASTYSSGSALFSTSNTDATNTVAGAGAFLRQAATGAHSTFTPLSNLLGEVQRGGEEQNFEEFEEGNADQQRQQAHALMQHRTTAGLFPSLSSVSGIPAAAIATGNTVAAILHQKQQAVPKSVSAAAASVLKPTATEPITIARQLFKLSNMKSGVAPLPEEDDEEDELADLPPEEREFILNTRDLFEEVDPELLSEQFVPHEHVVGIIASEDTGGEATPDEIEEKLEPYRDLDEEINQDLDEYIEMHHNEFNKAIADFSEMILAVSGSDDTLARLKVQLVQAAASLDSHGEQLRVLRLRAARSLYMADTLQRIQDAVTMEGVVRQLLQSKHYLRAVQILKVHQVTLQEARMKQVRATQGLRDFVESTMATTHSQIIDDLLNCVFRQDRLIEADEQHLSEMIDGSDNVDKNSVTAPSVQSVVQSYWKLTSGVRPSDLGVGQDAAAAAEEGGSSQRTLAAIVEFLYDDPSEESLPQNYLKFIPICVKSLQLLDRLDHLHESLFSRASKNMERFIAHFLRLYASWRRRMISGTSLSNSGASSDPGGATIRAIRVRAFDLTSDVLSADEAVAIVQARELRAMLVALFTELEKILRNANYLHKIVMVASFPFLSEFIVQPVPFDVAATSNQWDIHAASLNQYEGQLRSILTSSLDATRAEIAVLQKNSPPPMGHDFFVVFARLLQFFRVEELLAQSTGDLVTPAQFSPVLVSTTSSSTKPTLTLSDILAYLDRAVQNTVAKYPDPDDADMLKPIYQSLTEKITSGVRSLMVKEVSQLLLQWNLQVLWTQLNFHTEFVFHVLCDAQEAEMEGEDLVTLKPFLRQKNFADRVQRSATTLREAERQSSVEESPSLDKILGTYHSSTGLLKMMTETGTISFSLLGAVKKAQRDAHRVNEGQMRQFQSDEAKLLALAESGSAGRSGVGAPLVLLSASGLRHWFVFTAMNAISCYECASRFYARCCDRVPELRPQGGDNSVLGFFKRFLRTTYIPTLHAFHSQQLQRLCIKMGDTTEMTDAMNSNPPLNKAGENHVATTPQECAASEASNRRTAAARQQAALHTTAVWPTVAVPGASSPVLACVHYVGQVLEKVSSMRNVLPGGLAEDVEQSTSEALVIELAAFLKRKVQLLGRGTMPYRLLNSAFEDAFNGVANRRWAVLCDEENLLQTHEPIDRDLYKYYKLNSAQRTSGHEYNHLSAATLDAFSALEDGGADLDERIGLIPAQDLCLKDDSSIVALAILCSSTEWLCESLLKNLWLDGRHFADYTNSCVPGYLFNKQLSAAEGRSISVGRGQTRAQRQIRLAAHLTRLCSVSQVSLFYLSTEVRFAAFCYLPQLRDESYSLVASSASADTFVEAYGRRLKKIFQLVRPHIHPKKIKYTCLTAGKPASELILMELAHLRDKGISDAGLARLRTNLLVMQISLQLILPTDVDLREAVGLSFTRPAVFLQYIPNRDLVNELLSSGDYKRFTTEEIEVLIRLVFRQVSGANDDSLACKHIALFHEKVSTMTVVQQQQREQLARAATSPTTPSQVGTQQLAAPAMVDSTHASLCDDPSSLQSEEENEEHTWSDSEERGPPGTTQPMTPVSARSSVTSMAPKEPTPSLLLAKGPLSPPTTSGSRSTRSVNVTSVPPIIMPSKPVAQAPEKNTEEETEEYDEEEFEEVTEGEEEEEEGQEI